MERGWQGLSKGPQVESRRKAKAGSGAGAVIAMLAGTFAPATGALAQSAPVVAQPVVQALPVRDSQNLNAALARLARDPRDASALLDAGKAALAMGDVDAAIGFFNRADQVSPGNPAVKAGLAGALVRNENPYDAIPLFEEAERAGAIDSALAADRGLAYDLVGDNLTAQRHYRLALARGSSEEVTRRLALSHAIAGDRRSAESTLAPLLQRQDKAAWRTRAFMLAILGQTEDAVAIANQTLTPQLANAIAPYLRYMPRLTPAQQAAAANFGHFPRASEIGRDDPRVARFAPKTRPQVASADAALTPRGDALGRSSRSSRAASRAQEKARTTTQPARQQQVAVAAAQPPRVAPPVPVPARQMNAPTAAPVLAAASPPAAPVMAAPPAQVTAPALAVAAPPPARPVPAPPVPAPVMAPTAPAPAPQAAAPVPGFASLDPALAMAAPAAGPPAALATAPQPAPPPRPSLLEAFADLGRPAADPTPVAGAVDVRRIAAPRPKPKEEAKPPPPSHPSRIWVQVATGRDKRALGFDWRRMTQKAEAAFRGKSAHVSDWGQTNRLLTGPFPNAAAANQFIAQLRRADLDGAFVWTSPAGQVVDALPGR